ncbi:hypothetical protein K438DRAFT_1833889 [Mycena galopus ATCC 62051]|nr:hypothetical protein K438DRAFT_1833889 [Mycena galopus ATCC 62051]
MRVFVSGPSPILPHASTTRGDATCINYSSSDIYILPPTLSLVSTTSAKSPIPSSSLISLVLSLAFLSRLSAFSVLFCASYSGDRCFSFVLLLAFALVLGFPSRGLPCYPWPPTAPHALSDQSYLSPPHAQIQAPRS